MPDSFRLHVPRVTYRGSDPRKRAKNTEHNRLAALIEDYLNEQRASQSVGPHVYHYHQVARALNLTEKQVHDVLTKVEAGHNAITLWRNE